MDNYFLSWFQFPTHGLEQQFVNISRVTQLKLERRSFVISHTCILIFIAFVRSSVCVNKHFPRLLTHQRFHDILSIDLGRHCQRKTRVSLIGSRALSKKCRRSWLVRKTFRLKSSSNAFAQVLIHKLIVCARTCLVLTNLSYCSFVDFMRNESGFLITRNQITRDVPKVGISNKMKIKIGLRLREGVTSLTERTGELGKFKSSGEIASRANLLGTSFETLREVTEQQCKYRFEKIVTSRGFYTPINYGEDQGFRECCFFLSTHNADSNAKVEVAHVPFFNLHWLLTLRISPKPENCSELIEKF